MHTTSKTIFSGIKPTGQLTLGNYLGALGRFVSVQHDAFCLFAVVDLHALTVGHDPYRLRSLSREAATLYLAAGLDPSACLLFRQSDVPEHTELAYLLECTSYTGELNRMIQFKEKGRHQPKTRVSLFTYPLLMAADILAYNSTHVPVGDDQRQHLELTRTVAERFNRTYGTVFTMPELMPADIAARVMDLQTPTAKMSKDASDGAMGVIRLLDSPAAIRQKIMRAVTDSGSTVRYEPDSQPGIANLLEILGAATGQSNPTALATGYSSYGALKRDTADAVVALLQPIRERYATLDKEPEIVEDILAAGADRARELAAGTVRAAKSAIGVGARRVLHPA